MKKLFLRITSVALVLLLLFAVGGCKVEIPAESSIEVGKTDKQKGLTELSSQDSLICTLIEYLHDLSLSHDMPDTSTAIKINEIKNGKQALHVGVDKSRYYFVCAYYHNTHENETTAYCCATNYIWIKFENANEISEKYKDLKFVAAFQINQASFVTDIVTRNATVPNIEHFQEYVTHFNNGFNANGAIAFDTSFIYLNSTNDRNVYHSIFAYDNMLKTFPCEFLNDQYYIIQSLYTVYPNGNRSDSGIVTDFGDYYDALVSVMDTKSYSETDEKGRTIIYGLIEIDDFANCING